MRLMDRAARLAVRAGLMRRSTALIETVGRKSGLPRVTPVTNGLDGDVFWIVTEHGRRAAYVLNIEANPRVRIRTRKGWHAGTAAILPDDDPRERLRHIAKLHPITRVNTATVRLMETQMLTIRVDLDPVR